MGLSKRRQVEPGFYLDMSNEDYHRNTYGVSSSMLKTLIEKTPAHLKYKIQHPDLETEAMLLGTVVHTLVLEPEKFESEFAVMPNYNGKSKSGKLAIENFIGFHPGKKIITEPMHNRALKMAESVNNHPNAALLLEDALKEVSVYWWYDLDKRVHEDDTEYRTLLKVRPDALSTGHSVAIDLKTTRDGSYTGFSKTIANLYYHLSAAMYLEGINQNAELCRKCGHFSFLNFVFIVVENEPPYECSVYELGPEFLELGKALFRRAVRAFQIGKDNDWPGYDENIRVIEPPAYANRVWTV